MGLCTCEHNGSGPVAQASASPAEMKLRSLILEALLLVFKELATLRTDELVWNVLIMGDLMVLPCALEHGTAVQSAALT